MPYYNECPYCGATLDPGERCDCHKSREARAALMETQQPKKPGRPGRRKKEAAA